VLDRTTFADEKVVAESKRFVTLRVDMTNEEPPVAKRFTVVNPPAIVFFDSQGKERKDLHLVNKEVGPERFLDTLKKIS
jgi:thiol:disulfide interchange protein DsbD